MTAAAILGSEREDIDIDESVVLYGAPWSLYERLLELRGESSYPRLTYLDGELELMSPSQSHDLVKKCLAWLLERWAEERGIRVTGVGSWTLRKKKKKGGLEPDECYRIEGDLDDPERFPDLAIEVVVSSWKVDKLEVYRRLKIPEVWVWRDGEIFVYALGAKGYAQIADSQVLPGIDLVLLERLAPTLDQPAAIRELLASMRR